MLTAKLFRFYLGLIFILSSQTVSAANEQTNNVANTMSLQPGMVSPKASIADVAWITGYWQGEIWGGKIEEIWSAPLAGSMMASFKFAADQQVKFYEIIRLAEQDGSLTLRLKHFSAELTGWEEKDDYMEFKLVKITDNEAYFDGYTYRLVSPNELHVFVVIEDKGEKTETKFVFKQKT
ncbi:DUF6265 family protein [Paraglaciecola sp.]|uniref:DUF6265 family protein n=1 Tax=Paraglaciecola sp. TaxID=1920173 RepID=UPI0030F4A8B3